MRTQPSNDALPISPVSPIHPLNDLIDLNGPTTHLRRKQNAGRICKRAYGSEAAKRFRARKAQKIEELEETVKKWEALHARLKAENDHLRQAQERGLLREDRLRKRVAELEVALANRSLSSSMNNGSASKKKRLDWIDLDLGASLGSNMSNS